MNLKKLIFTENACYKAGKKITPKGIIVHSTGANNPNLKRYVNPDDGLLGKNLYGNHWNTYHPSGREVCVHAFIGKLKDGSVATYQTLPWDHRGWHCGGTGNNTHIGFEICEDNLTDAAYFNKVYQEAVELCAYLCKEFNLTENDVICHSEAYKKGIASNHGDVMHWFPKFGKSMDSFRGDVKALLNESKSEGVKYRVQIGAYSEKSLAEAQLAKAKAAGFFDAFIVANGEEKIAEVAKPTEEVKVAKKTNEELAKEVINGDWGNGAERKKRLTDAGYNYSDIQKIVNQMLK